MWWSSFTLTTACMFCVCLCYRGGELQSRVDGLHKALVQARLQADDVIDEHLFNLREAMTDQV